MNEEAYIRESLYSTTIMKKIIPAFQQFQDHYAERFTKIDSKSVGNKGGITETFWVTSSMLKKGNHPRIYYHGKKTKDVIVLTHGLSDSPHYMDAVARRFYKEGLNVILALLPAHGLKDPDKAMEDRELDSKWREEIDACISVAEQLGNRISLGGFSAGGALSYNAILRQPKKIKGGLFLFAAAIDVALVNNIGRISFIRTITKITDGVIFGVGRNPYKYPCFPKYGALELGDIIRENIKLGNTKKIKQPVFAAHSIEDKTAKLEGVLDLVKNKCVNGIAFLISANVAHGEVPLSKDITLDNKQTKGPKRIPKANPDFEAMMDSMIRFFKNRVEAG